ncbi:MAG: hypothetical protein Q9173_001904 [Seirophora scorigena]
MYAAVYLLLHLLSLRAVLAATIPVQPNLSAGSSDGAGFVDNDITANQSSLVYDSPSAYTGPLDAQKSVLCDGANFGTGLNLRSCVDAVQQLNRESTQILSFGPREVTPKAKYLLPMRSSSGDGRCVIDVVSGTRNSPRDYASVRMIRDAATEIIQTCVDGRDVNDRGAPLCLAKIEIAAGHRVDVATWYDIWAAAEAVSAMCVRRGVEGIAIHLG